VKKNQDVIKNAARQASLLLASQWRAKHNAKIESVWKILLSTNELMNGIYTKIIGIAVRRQRNSAP
jgi:hypothetical protein